MNWIEFDIWCGALCAWREARGEGGPQNDIQYQQRLRDALRGVLHVIHNRSTIRRISWAQVVFEKWQFSSMTAPNDPQLSVVPHSPDPIFAECYEIASIIRNGGDFDLTYGATHYFSDIIPAPAWIKGMQFTTKLGHHSFYKEPTK